MFVDVVREKIKTFNLHSPEREVLKVLLGELQREGSIKPLTDEKSFAIVRKLVKGNEETMGFLEKNDSKHQKLVQENNVLNSLVPSLWSEEDLNKYIVENNLKDSILAAKSEGQAIGELMKSLKTIQAPVEGDVVKKLISKLRS